MIGPRNGEAFLLALLAASLAPLIGCDRPDPAEPSSTVRMKLPPAQPAEAKPGFSTETRR